MAGVCTSSALNEKGMGQFKRFKQMDGTGICPGRCVCTHKLLHDTETRDNLAPWEPSAQSKPNYFTSSPCHLALIGWMLSGICQISARRGLECDSSACLSGVYGARALALRLRRSCVKRDRSDTGPVAQTSHRLGWRVPPVPDWLVKRSADHVRDWPIVWLIWLLLIPQRWGFSARLGLLQTERVQKGFGE